MTKPSETYRFQGFRRPYYTQVPDAVFDELLPQLSGAELKVLLYIIRRTFGFKKDQDDIALSQMVGGIVTRDGRRLDHGAGVSEASAIRAVQSLCEMGILEARRNYSAERGHEATTYHLRYADGEALPFSQNERSLPSKMREGLPSSRGEQETVLQETEEQETDVVTSARHLRPPVYPAERAALLPYAEGIAREFNDNGRLAWTLSRLVNVWAKSGLGIPEFATEIDAARAITKERHANIRSLDESGYLPRKRAVGYFFGVLEKRLLTDGATTS